METTRGKSILNRMSHFFKPDEVGDVLSGFVDVFGHRLDWAEEDLQRVDQSHFIESAEDDGNQQRASDLDRLYSFYLGALGDTNKLITINPRFNLWSFDARELSHELLNHQNPMSNYLVAAFSEASRETLVRYQVNNTLFKADEISFSLLSAIQDGKNTLCHYVREGITRNNPQMPASWKSGENTEGDFRDEVAAYLNKYLLWDPALYWLNYDYFERLQLTENTLQLVHSMHKPFLRGAYHKINDYFERNRRLKFLEQTEERSHTVGYDRPRLNRMLLETAWDLTSRNIPSVDQVRQVLSSELNHILEGEDIYVASRFPDLAEDYPFLKERYQDNTLWLNRVILESAFPLLIEKSCRSYRERITSLIQVLSQGASTPAGIVRLVEICLGITGNKARDAAARAKIGLEEYFPEKRHYFKQELVPGVTFEVNNPDTFEVVPEIRIFLEPHSVKTVGNIRVLDVNSGKVFRYKGRLSPGDYLIFRGGQVLLNDFKVGNCEVPTLKPGKESWRLDFDEFSATEPLMPDAYFSKNAYDSSCFAADHAKLLLEIFTTTITPGVFTVTVPWHLPGFTDKFEETRHHPRHQVLSLINRVKAAGIRALIDYRQIFDERHDFMDALSLKIESSLLNDKHDLQESLGLKVENWEEDHVVLDDMPELKIERRDKPHDLTEELTLKIESSLLKQNHEIAENMALQLQGKEDHDINLDLSHLKLERAEKKHDISQSLILKVGVEGETHDMSSKMTALDLGLAVDASKLLSEAMILEVQEPGEDHELGAGLANLQVARKEETYESDTELTLNLDGSPLKEESQVEDKLSIAQEGTMEQHEMSDKLVFTARLNYTTFDSLNRLG